jgi:tRNA (mo5U34)-methyltransferase
MHVAGYNARSSRRRAMNQTPTSPEIARQVAEHAGWYHRIEVAPGIVTPGSHDSPAALARLDRIGLPRACSSLRALDLGCRDGFFAFELERRGARVVALDYTRSDATGFALAARLLGSAVQHRFDNVYNVGPESYGQFDLVLFLGLIYHLRDPVRALDRIRSVCRPGSLLFVESAVDPPRGEPALPLWRFAPRDSHNGDGTSKWIPTLAGLQAVLSECQFEPLAAAEHGDRGLLACRAFDDPALEFYRGLDSAIDAPAQPNAFWRERPGRS